MYQMRKGFKDLREDKKRTVFRRIMPILYFLILSIMIGMILTDMIQNEKRVVDLGLESFQPITNALTLEDGTTFDLEKIDTYEKDKEGAINIRYQIPADLKMDESIVFRSKNTFVTVYVAGDKQYETDFVNGIFYNRSPGTRWNYILLPKEAAGSYVEFQVKLSYMDGRSKVDMFFQGDRGAIVLYILKVNGFSILFCLFMFVMGIMYFVANAVINWHRKAKDLSLFYLGIFAIMSALWAFLETNTLQFFYNDQQTLQVIDNILLIVGAVPIFFYMDEAYKIFKNRVIRILCISNIIYMLFAMISQMMGYLDYHETLNTMTFNYGMVIITLIFGLIKRGLENRRNKYKDIRHMEYVLQQIGLFMLWTAITADYLRYNSRDVLDPALYTRVGLAGFIIFFGLGTMNRLIQLVKQGRESELISKLAYYDGLTQVGNRTAYMERIQQLPDLKLQEGCGIIMLDINNLKEANDSFGHQYGDSLIRKCAELIESGFGEVGEIYRIGGDEFMVLILSDFPEQSYEQALMKFSSLVAAANEDVECRRTPISIAHGVGFCKKLTRYNLKICEQEADSNMYKNKAEMKRLDA